MYADDTQIFSSSYDANELVVKLNSDLAHVFEWMKENRLQMHPSKCKMMFVGSTHYLNKLGCEEPIMVNAKPIPRISTQMYWDSHITLICKKVSPAIGVMRRMKPFVPMHTLESVYKSLVQPYFDYCSPFRDTCGKLLRDKLQKFQSRAARVVTGANYESRGRLMFLTHSRGTLLKIDVPVPSQY